MSNTIRKALVIAGTSLLAAATAAILGGLLGMYMTRVTGISFPGAPLELAIGGCLLPFASIPWLALGTDAIARHFDLNI